jgi:uncharacterized protein (TIGR03437 family)
LTHDFVELFNRSSSVVNLSGWTVQYASSAGSSWDRATVSGVLAPGQYFLLQLARGSGGSTGLPAPDATAGIALSAASGKLALVRVSTLLTGDSPASADIEDFVGYGAANFAEGRSTAELSNTTAAIRRAGGCTDTNQNGDDFTVGSPAPRNSRSAPAPCAAPAGPQITAAGVTNGASFKSGPVAAGELVTIFGSDLGPSTLAPIQLTSDGRFVTKSLNGTRVLFDGIEAPLVYTSARQVSAIVPYAVRSQSRTTLEVEFNARLSNRVQLDVVPAAPALFTADSSGSGQGAILNSDNRPNHCGNPAAKGSIVVLYATGTGETIPAGTDGLVVLGEPPRQALDVRVSIGGQEASVLYAGGAPGLVSGVAQINAVVPESVASGAVSVTITAGGVTSPAGVSVCVGASEQQDGVGPLIEEKLERLKREVIPPALAEIPTDRSPVPEHWLALLTWNIQVGGTSATGASARPPMVRDALHAANSGTYQVLAAQEIPSDDSVGVLQSLLPGGSSRWTTAFVDTTDTMDNAISAANGVVIRDLFVLATTSERDNSGRVRSDPARAVHPPLVAQLQAGDFDFTLISLHLTFADGDTAESARELRTILDYLDWYFGQPGHDPDVVLCGDFNMPSDLSGETSRGITVDKVLRDDPRFSIGERRFAVTVHVPTSRSPASNGGQPSRNYDHCVLSADTMEEFVQARRMGTNILTDHPEDPEDRLTSDHFPIVAFFRTRGDGVTLDNRKTFRPTSFPTEISPAPGRYH